MLERQRAVIVMGLGPSGLFLIRQLSQITEKIYAIGRDDDIGMYSRHVSKERRYWAATREKVQAAFARILEAEGEKPLLYISSDQYLTLLLEIGDDLGSFVELAGSDIDTLRLINNKERTVDFCREHHIQIPESFSFSQFEGMQTENFPVIVKWNEKVLGAGKNPIGKVKVCVDRAKFCALAQQIRQAGVDPSSIHVQTYIRGNNGCQYSVGGYYQDGMPLACMTVNQIRQYPQGISAMVQSAGGKLTEQLEKTSFAFARSVGFTGFLEMEYKVDAKTHIPYLLDINPRPWGWVSALGAAYTDFYKVLLGQRPASARQSVLWKSPMRCLLSVRNKKNVAPQEDATEYQRAWDIADPTDKVPGVMIYGMMVKKILGRR